MNQSLVMAAEEKLTPIQTTEACFSARKGIADRDAAIRFLTRAGGESPQTGDELPDQRFRVSECELFEKAARNVFGLPEAHVKTRNAD